MKLNLADVRKPKADGSYWDGNVYYAPEQFGLTTLDEAEHGGSYEFDTCVVWKDSEGRLWWAQDAGCSCPTPFEDTTELDRVFTADDLPEGFREELRPKVEEALRELAERPARVAAAGRLRPE
jgi:hypothetical protein